MLNGGRKGRGWGLQRMCNMWFKILELLRTSGRKEGPSGVNVGRCQHQHVIPLKIVVLLGYSLEDKCCKMNKTTYFIPNF